MLQDSFLILHGNGYTLIDSDGVKPVTINQHSTTTPLL